MTTPKQQGDKALWEALENLDDDLLDPNMPDAEVDATLRDMGVDPKALAAGGRQLGRALGDKKRLAWQDAARTKQKALRRIAASAPVVGEMNREEMLARLDELRAEDPVLGTAIKAAARKRKPEESTDEDLRSLLEDMEALRAIEKGGRGS